MMMAAGGLLALVIGLAGCGSKATETPAFTFQGQGEGRGEGESPAQFAIFGRSRQLALNMLYLQGSAAPFSADQAAVLLPLWQQVKTLEEAETINADDVTPVLDQIEAGLTAEQSDLLANTSVEDLAAWAQAQGIEGVGGPGFGGGRGFGGNDGDDNQPSDEEMATFMAAQAQGTPGFEGTPPAEGDFEGGPPGGGGRFNNTELIDQVIAMLEAL